MRVLLDLTGLADPVSWAAEAEEAGVFGVLVDSDLAAVDAPPVALATSAARIVVRVVLGEENPVTFAEELAVLDAISGGRVVGLLAAPRLDAVSAAEDVTLLRQALTSRPIRHRGVRWQVPAGVNDGVPDAVVVTPGTVQVELPLWIDGVRGDHGLPRMLREVSSAPTLSGVQPATAVLSGDLASDRDLVAAWAAAGATHLVVVLWPGARPGVLRDYIARHLIPEAGMVDFPRLLAEAAPPPVWPGVDGGDA